MSFLTVFLSSCILFWKRSNISLIETVHSEIYEIHNYLLIASRMLDSILDCIQQLQHLIYMN